jgi:hypothetical protein
MYQPQATSAECAWCGQRIAYVPSETEDFPWVSVAGFTVDRECFDSNPHVPTFDVLIRRDGAASRTGDELAAVFVLDVHGMTEEVRALSNGEREDVELASSVSGWCDDPDDSQALSDAVRDWEHILSDAGYGVAWDDGYQIWRLAE